MDWLRLFWVCRVTDLGFSQLNRFKSIDVEAQNRSRQ
jgi:hypothetical protein